MSHNSFLFALVILHLPENVATNQVCIEHVIINFFSIHVVQSSDVWKVPTSDNVNQEDIKLALNRWKNRRQRMMSCCSFCLWVFFHHMNWADISPRMPSKNSCCAVTEITDKTWSHWTCHGYVACFALQP